MDSGGGARKVATPQNWRVRVLVSSERSSLTPRAVGDADGDGDSDKWLGEGSACGFDSGGDFALAMGTSSFPLSSLSSLSSSFRELAIDLASHDIVDPKTTHSFCEPAKG